MQNNNESLNSLIWTFSPKHIHSGKAVLDVATYLSVCIFNDGFSNILRIMEAMGLVIGPSAQYLATSRDETRITQADHRATMKSKMARTAAREERAAREAMFEAEEGPLYSSGIAE